MQWRDWGHNDLDLCNRETGDIMILTYAVEHWGHNDLDLCNRETGDIMILTYAIERLGT